ncbi:MAG: hypothetical protein U5K51_14640 [Flavobacteriaceae bacterium]|nr:hypothetical protein [Flavobacteriaceae bacterium]
MKEYKRVAISPKFTKLFIDNGFEMILEDSAGERASFKNADYSDLGVKIEKKRGFI